MKLRSDLAVLLSIFSIANITFAQAIDLPLTQPGFESGFDLPLNGPRTQPNGLLVSVFDKPTPDSRRDLLAIQQAAIDIAKRATPCTVGLRIGMAMGSGVIISEDGYILTAAHVVSDPGRRVAVMLPDGREVRGESLGLHTTADGAMVKILEEGPWPFIPLATEDQGPEPGDWCLAIGHPGGFDKKRTPPVRLGRVIDVQATVMRTDCPITGGDSGGPLVDLQGRLIGIHSRISEDVTENYHVPSSAYHEAWDELKAGDIYPKPIPSKVLAMLDRNSDGLLTKGELRSKYQKRVFDRLVKEFDLPKDEEISIRSILKDKLKWKTGVRVGIVEIEDVRDYSHYVLRSNDFARGPVLRRLVAKSLKQVDVRRESIGDAEYVSDLAVRVYADGRRVALGTIVDDAGLIVTKASRLDHNSLECRMPDGTRRTAEIVARDEGYDLALLQVTAGKVAAPDWNTSPIKTGQLVVVPDNGDDIESIGVVGVLPREIELIPAKMGIRIEAVVISNVNGKRITEAKVGYVVPKSGADRAGVQVGDVVLRVTDKDVSNLDEILDIVNEYRAGDEISIVLRRANEEIKLNIGLLSLNDLFLDMGGTFAMSGRLSRRRDGFESAFQIDAVVEPQYCGGPVVDMNGRLVGVTLARASRLATYAISGEDLQPVLDRMRSQASSVSTTRLEKTSTKAIE